ncbi:hypothetical protein LY78DRAFT_131553 [Colletotrichum sublineola]|nr:hypothetical protein LY78DRAFT_131553 [Colletotrichum sublineola]
MGRTPSSNRSPYVTSHRTPSKLVFPFCSTKLDNRTFDLISPPSLPRPALQVWAQVQTCRSLTTRPACLVDEHWSGQPWLPHQRLASAWSPPSYVTMSKYFAHRPCPPSAEGGSLLLFTRTKMQGTSHTQGSAPHISASVAGRAEGSKDGPRHRFWTLHASFPPHARPVT